MSSPAWWSPRHRSPPSGSAAEWVRSRACSHWVAPATSAISSRAGGAPGRRWEDRSVELDPVDRITTDATGEPGERVFYIQARQGSTLVTVVVEKQQLQLLAASILEILSRVGKETGQGPDEEEMALEEPVEPRWRAGRLSIGYLEERDLILLEIEELLPEDETDETPEVAGLDPLQVEEIESIDTEREADRVRLWATRE